MKIKRLLLIPVILAVVVGGAWKWSLASEHTSATLRPMAVAGQFYPKGPDELLQTVRSLLKSASGLKIGGKIRGLVSPHAGYIYSGIVAAAGYRQIDPSINTVILIGPSHHVLLRGASIPDVKAYQTPLGNVSLAKLALTIRKLPLFVSMPEAHEKARQAMLLVLDDILSEANRVLLSYQKRYGKNVSKTVLTGGGAILKELLPLAKKHLETEVELSDPFAKVETPAFLSDILKEVGPEFSVAVGLAFRKLQEYS